MKVNNMKELLEYVANKRKKQAHQHYEVAKIYGECKGMGNTRYKVSQKATFAKFKKFTYNKMWRGYDEKYDLKTMKL
tara:strand:+ start:6038 stop:6268 length:231 start_codon:yes stop_codon:yes gene_type:complete